MSFIIGGGSGGGGAGGALAGFSGLAAQLGLSSGSGGGSPQSPAFYQELLHSHAVLGPIADSATLKDSLGVVRSIPDALGIRPAPPLMRRELTIAALAGSFTAGEERAGIMRITVRSGNPQYAYQLCGMLLDAVLRFNERQRQSTTTDERQFAEQERAEMRAELDSAEVRLRDFLSSNRGGTAPELNYQRDRLQREVSIHQDVYTAVSQAYEKARMDEARDSPLVTVIDRPELAAMPEERHLARTAIMGTIAGVILGLVLAFLTEAATPIVQWARKRSWS